MKLLKKKQKMVINLQIFKKNFNNKTNVKMKIEKKFSLAIWIIKFNKKSLIDLRLLIDDLKEICQEYYERVYACEGQKWDLEREVRKRDYEVQYKPIIESI